MYVLIPQEAGKTLLSRSNLATCIPFLTDTEGDSRWKAAVGEISFWSLDERGMSKKWTKPSHERTISLTAQEEEYVRAIGASYEFVLVERDRNWARNKHNLATIIRKYVRA